MLRRLPVLQRLSRLCSASACHPQLPPTAAARPRLAWQDEYELVGVVLGLAAYNGVILAAHLPTPFFKKLAGLVRRAGGSRCGLVCCVSRKQGGAHACDT